MRVITAALILALAPACERAVSSPEPAEVAPPNTQLARELELVAAARVFFAHASLGTSVLDGVVRIPGSSLRVFSLDASAPLSLPAASFSQLPFASDGDPEAKIATFEKLLASQLQPGADVALLELSCEDIGADTDTKALFTRYREAIERLKRAYPHTVFVHVTAPLTPRDARVADLAKRLTGLSDDAAQANARRDEYNGRVREAFRGEPIFDLAALESVWPDGRPERFVRGGASHPSLVAAYDAGDGRLAGVGRELAARALIHTLADALREHAAR